ncbi:MAG: rhodanese-like domain-containing protein [Deltaproteobacteria bacterium]|jgi:rhodanese-related sulfurtransferase|nr:rhodanese-like domain-containing protein [Deltaproteobacteria bacterium]
MLNRKTIKEIIILVGVSVLLALVVNHLSPRGIDLVGQWDTAKGVITANAADENEYRIAEIDRVTDAAKIFYDGDTLFVDARSLGDYESGHIPGAISLPVGQFDEHIESFMNQYPLDQPIIAYCSGRTCEDSHHLARLLLEAGYSEIRIFIDGFPGWQAEGYPIE